MPPEVYRSFGFPGADDLGNMFQFKRDFNDYFRGARSVDFSRSLNPELQSFDQWLSRNGSKIPIEAPALILSGIVILSEAKEPMAVMAPSLRSG